MPLDILRSCHEGLAEGKGDVALKALIQELSFKAPDPELLRSHLRGDCCVPTPNPTALAPRVPG